MAETAAAERFTLAFTAPLPFLESTKEAVFEAGAGTWPGQHYSRVCFETKGTGQFLPESGAVPNIGAIGKLEVVEEVRVEVLCVGRDVVLAAVKALKRWVLCILIPAIVKHEGHADISV